MAHIGLRHCVADRVAKIIGRRRGILPIGVCAPVRTGPSRPRGLAQASHFRLAVFVPRGYYRLTQGVHMGLGLVLVPVVITSSDRVIPRLLVWPPARSIAQVLERISLVMLVGGILFENSHRPAVHPVRHEQPAGRSYTLYCPSKSTANFGRRQPLQQVFSPNIGEYGSSTNCGGVIQSGNVYHESGAPLTLGCLEWSCAEASSRPFGLDPSATQFRRKSPAFLALRFQNRSNRRDWVGKVAVGSLTRC